MPPQQSYGLLDRFNQLFGFGAHDPTNQFDGAMSALKTPFSGAAAGARPSAGAKGSSADGV
jgi:hypothetical protein